MRILEGYTSMNKMVLGHKEVSRQETLLLPQLPKTPRGLGKTKGMKLTISLRDATCMSKHAVNMCQHMTTFHQSITAYDEDV